MGRKSVSQTAGQISVKFAGIVIWVNTRKPFFLFLIGVPLVPQISQNLFSNFFLCRAYSFLRMSSMSHKHSKGPLCPDSDHL